jgi:large subunit ribosomal protein L23
MKSLYNVLKGPCLTEKSALLQEKSNKIAFKVNPASNKIEIKLAVEKMFPVKVKHVHTANMHGKQKRVGRFTGFRDDWKKAYVTLSEGQINFADEL